MSIFGDLINVGITIVNDRLKIGTKPGQYPELQLEVEMEVTGAKGDLGYISNYDATTKRPTFSLADANAVGKIATHVLLKSASAAAKGRVVSMGIVTGTASQILDTNAFSIGDLVYLTATSTTTNTWGVIPTGIDDVVMAVGTVIVVSATVGQIYFYPGMCVPQTYGNVAIPDASITLAKMAVESIDSDQYVDGSIDAVHLAPDVIDETKLADNSLDSEHYNDGSIDPEHFADNAVTSDKVEAELIQYVDVQFDNTAVLALATPAELIPAPAANKIILVDKVLLVSDSGGGAWTETNAPDELQIQYTDGTVITAELDSTGFVTTGDVQVRSMRAAEAVIVPDVAVAVVLHNTGVDFGGGNAANTLSVRIWFSEADAIAFS